MRGRDIMEIKKMYINGEWVEAISKKTRDVINPANGQVICKDNRRWD